MKKMLMMMAVLVVPVMAVLSGCQAGVSPLEDTRWIIVSYGETGNLKGVLPDARPTVRFDSGTKAVRGSGGCNSYTGGYEVDGNKLTMTGPFAVTEMWCGDEKGAQESEYLDSLLVAKGFVVSSNTLTITSGNGFVLNFERE